MKLHEDWERVTYLEMRMGKEVMKKVGGGLEGLESIGMSSGTLEILSLVMGRRRTSRE